MSLDLLTQRITKDRQDAQNVLANAQNSYANIRNDRTLSGEGQRAQMAQVYLAAAQRVQALQADEASAVQDKTTEITKALFGTATNDSSTIIAYRDAQDRAARLDNPTEASGLMGRALLTNDTTLATALLERAIDSSWVEVIDAYTSAHPDQGDRLNDLRALGQMNSTQSILSNSFAYMVSRPSEISSMQDWELKQAAANTSGSQTVNDTFKGFL